MPSALMDAQAAIWTRLATAFPTLAIAYPGTPFTTPVAAPWVRASLVWGDGALSTMGATNRNTIIGMVQLEVYTPAAQGDGINTVLVDTLRDVYNRVEADGVRYTVPSGPRPAQLDSIWYRSLIRVPFSVDELIV